MKFAFLILAHEDPDHLRRDNKNVVAFRETDYEELIRSGKLFCRKTRTGISDGLLGRFDAYRFG